MSIDAKKSEIEKLNKELEAFKEKIEDYYKYELEIQQFESKIMELSNEKKDLQIKRKQITKGLLRKQGTINKEEIDSGMKNYDIIIDCKSLLAPFIFQKSQGYYSYMDSDTAMPIVSVIGTFDRGKTFILSELANIEYPSGFDFETPWICGVFPKKRIDKNDESFYLNCLLLDTAGFNSPAQYNKFDSKELKMRESFSNLKISKDKEEEEDDALTKVYFF